MTFYIIWALFTLIIIGIYTGIAIDRINFRFIMLSISILINLLLGITCSYLFNDTCNFIFLLFITFASYSLIFVIIAAKSFMWYTRLMMEDEAKLREEAIKNNPYYQMAHEEVTDIINNDNRPRVNLKK